VTLPVAARAHTAPTARTVAPGDPS
jgi:hypothetical protein